MLLFLVLCSNVGKNKVFRCCFLLCAVTWKKQGLSLLFCTVTGLKQILSLLFLALCCNMEKARSFVVVLHSNGTKANSLVVVSSFILYRSEKNVFLYGCCHVRLYKAVK